MNKESCAPAAPAHASGAGVHLASCSSRCRRLSLLHALLALVLASAHLASPAAAAICGQVSVYVAGTPEAGSFTRQVDYTLGTEWGVFPNEPLTESLCVQEAAAQSTGPHTAQSVQEGSYGVCSDVRGAADVGASVNAMSMAGWPRLSVSGSSKACWCTDGSSEPFVRLRVRQVTHSSSTGSSTSALPLERARIGRPSTGGRRHGRKALAAMMPLWPEDDEQQQQQLAGPDGCKGGALAGTAGSGHMVLLDSWYRVVRDETICQDSGTGHNFAFVFKLSDTC
ncbi:hypothetical protein COO60DRAFT_1627206 [Scenedesmus sp. NREL 46B-D3]|nr:hypothetical protein COO60DRAFT_1627206 [Scenedesmus sp. NREL 46B-D3]